MRCTWSLLLVGVLACGSDASRGAVADAGTREAAASDVATIGAAIALAVDDSHVFALDDESGRLRGRVVRIPRGGGVVQTLVGDVALSTQLTVDADNLYWSSADGIVSLPKTGGSLRVVAATPTRALALTRDEIVFGRDTGIGVLKKAGGAAETLVEHASSCGGGPSELLGVDDASIFFIDRLCGDLLRAPRGGGKAQPIDMIAADSAPMLVVRTNDVLWGMNGYVRRVPKDGGPPIELEKKYQAAERLVADDQRAFYFGHVTEGDAYRCALFEIREGADALERARLCGDCRAVAHAGGDIYVAVAGNACGGGRIVRIAK